MIFDLRTSLKEIIEYLGGLGNGKVAFIVDGNRLVGSITDGDIRRSLTSAKNTNTIDTLMNKDVKYIQSNKDIRHEFKRFKLSGITQIPIVNDKREIVKILDSKALKTILPVTAIIMAGGLGTRLAPLTDLTPKPLLIVGEKPIIDYTFDRLMNCGIDHYFIPVKYKAEMIQAHFQKKSFENIKLNFFIETLPLGTIGSLAYLRDCETEYVLLTNADVLTNICYETLYEKALDSNADIAVSTISYEVDIPYAVVESISGQITALTEKPKYTYQCNSGIYLIRTKLLSDLKENSRCDAPDFIESQIKMGRKVIYVNNDRFWLDIGKHKDFDLAQSLVKQINFD